MQAAGLIQVEPGQFGVRVSRVRSSDSLLQRFERQSWTLDDVATDQNLGQAIILKAAKEYHHQSNAPLAHYQDNNEIRAMRARMERVNSWIRGFDVGIYSADIDPGTLQCDSTDRCLHRIFTHGQFDHHGRLYGGFWIGMPKGERWRIAIGGKGLVQLDFNAMFVRLLYSQAGGVPRGDPYVWPAATEAGLSRGAVKKLLNARMFDEKPRRRYPKLDKDDPRDLYPDPTRLPLREALRCIETHHPDIAHLLGHRCGHRLFFEESEIVLRALELCRKSRIPALPVHDALLVLRKDFRKAGDLMAQAFRERTKLLGKESEPRIEATLLRPPNHKAALCRVGLQEWRFVREGTWQNCGSLAALIDGHPLPSPTRRDFLKGNRLATFGRLFALYHANKFNLSLARERGVTLRADTLVGAILIEATSLESALAELATVYLHHRDKRYYDPVTQAERDVKAAMRRAISVLDRKVLKQLVGELDPYFAAD